MDNFVPTPMPLHPNGSAISHKLLSYVTIISASCALLVVLAGVYVIKINGDSLLHRVYSVFILNDIRITEQFIEPVQYYSFGIFHLTPYSGAPSVLLTEYLSSTNNFFSIERDSTSTAQQVVLYNKSREVLTSYSGAKSSLASSNDGKYIAFSVATSSNVTSLLRRSWEIHLLDLTSRADRTLGIGYDAQFFERNGTSWLMFTSPSGLHIVNLEHPEKGFVTPFAMSEYIGSGLRVSADGMYMALRESSRLAYNLYKIERLDEKTPISIVPVSTDISSYADVLFVGNKHIYAIDLTADKDGNKSLYRIATATSKKEFLYSFPSQERVRFMQKQ